MTAFFRFIAVLIVMLPVTLSAQVDVVNKGMLIYIPKGHIISISGSYTDNSGHDIDPDEESSAALDASIFLSGTLAIKGNIVNNAKLNTKLIFMYDAPADTGILVLNGSGAQHITGTSDSYFPAVNINKPLGDVILQRDIEIDTLLSFTQGNLNLNSHSLKFLARSNIVGENSSRRILGYPGTVISQTYAINESIVRDNYRGIGVGYQTNEDGNFTTVVWQREHGPGDLQLADGVNALKVFRMSTIVTSYFDSLSIHYFANELNGLTETNLALYYSNDDGAHWTKAASVVNTTLGIVKADSVRAEAGNKNLFALAASNCAAIRLPDVSIASVAPAISSGQLDICDGALLTLSVPDDDDHDYVWTTPHGTSTDSQYTPFNVSYNDHSGNYSVFVKNERGCEAIGGVTVNVRAIPVAAMIIPSGPHCHQDAVLFTDNSSVAGASSINAREWTFTDATPAFSTEPNPSVTYTTPGTKTPMLRVRSNHLCWSPVVNGAITIQTLPTVAFRITDGVVNIPTRCEDTDVTFINQSTHPSSDLSYHWMFGDGNTAALQDPVHQYLAAGDYNITLRATADDTGCDAEATGIIKIHPEPIPFFTPEINSAAITEACEGVYVNFQNGTTMPDGTGITYAWQFGDGVASTDTNPVKQYVQYAVYDPVLTATSVAYGCSEKFTFNDLTIRPAPTGTFSVADADICVPDEVEIANNSAVAYGSLTNEWNFGDLQTTIDNALQVRHLYAHAQRARIQLTRTTNHGCVNTISKDIVIHPNPVAAFVHVNACDQQAIKFLNNSAIQSDAISSFSWNFGNVATSTEKEPAKVFPTYGTYVVSLTAQSNFGCVNTVEHPVEVYRKPSFNLGASVIGCANPFTLDPAVDLNAYIPTGSTFTWKNSLQEQVGNTRQLQVQQAGVYKLTIVTPTPQQCASTTSVPVFMFRPANLGNDIQSCSSIALDAEAGLAGEKALADNTTYEWRKDNVVVSQQQILNVLESGLYRVTIYRTYLGSTCSSTDEVNVQIDVPLAVSMPEQQTICEGQSVLLDAGITADSYRWTRLNTGEEFNSATLEVSGEGDYRLTVTNAGCEASVITSVIVSPAPSASFSLPAQQACADNAILITDHSYADVGQIVSREWNFGDNTTSTNPPSTSKVYAAGGSYTITLIATTDNGCTDEYSAILVVNENPIASFTANDACAQTDVPIVNNSSSGAVMSWNFSDGNNSADPQPVKSFEDAGLHTIELTVTQNGCSATETQNVTVHPLPAVEFGTNITTCGTTLLLDAYNPGATYNWFDPSNGNATLSVAQQYLATTDMQIGLAVTNGFGCSSTDVASVILNTPVTVNLGSDRAVCDQAELDAGYLPGGTYSWNVGDVTRTLEVSASGFYKVDVADQNGCTASGEVNIVVNSTPVITALNTNEQLCSGSDLTLDAGSTSGYSYAWSTGETTSAITVSTGGNYSVTVQNLNCTAQKTVAVELLQSPVAAFVAADHCEGSSNLFENNSSGSGVQYLWNFGDGTFSSSVNPQKKYDGHGSFTVTLTVQSSNACTAQRTEQLIVFAKPTAGFSAADACTNQNLVIANQSSQTGAGDTYAWDFGNGTFANGVTPPITYTTAGTYTINLLLTSAEGCSDNYLQEVVIKQTPSLSGWVSQLSSCNTSIALDAGNAGATFLWNDNSTTQVLNVNESGTYTVVITGANGCAVTASTNVLLYSPLIPELADAMEDCGEVALDPVADAATYLWSTGAQTKSIRVTDSGTYTVQLISQDLCVSNDQSIVTVNPVPVFELGTEISACEGERVTLAAESDIPATYAWSNGASTAAIDVMTSGMYSVTLTTARSCTFTDEITATFHALPVITLAGEINSCGPLELNAGNNGATYLWTTGATQQSIIASVSGTIGVVVTNKENCSASHVSEVTILRLPTVNLGNDVTLCHGATTQLDAGTSGNQFVWSDNSTQRTLFVGASGAYQVTVTNSAGCDATDEVQVTVRPPLPLELGPDRLLCSNDGQTLTASVNNATYTWGGSNGFASTDRSIKILGTGRYWVEVIDAFSCSARDSVTVSPTTENITASFLAPSAVAQGDEVHFAQLTEPKPTSFRWTFGDGGRSSEENPVHVYFKTGDFMARLIVSNGVCSDTLAKAISVRNGRVEVEPSVEMPKLIDFVTVSSYPNPTRGTFSIAVEMTTETEVYIALYSLKGITMNEQRKLILRDEVHFDIGEAADGVYLVRLICGDKVKIIKVLKSGGW